MRASVLFAAAAAALLLAAASHAAPLHKYNWSKMSLAQTMTVQRQIIVNDWRIITRWQASRWITIDEYNTKFVDRVKPASVTYAQNQMKWTKRELRERVKAMKEAARRQAATVSAYGGWDRIASCESGGNWSEVTGNGFYWGLQWVPSTWDSRASQLGLPSWRWFTHHHTAPSREMQIKAATGMSLSNWPVCGARW